jgi:hypothetical protein
VARDRRTGIPSLCPFLSSLSFATVVNGRLFTALMGAAARIAEQSGLSAEQRRLFGMAYLAGRRRLDLARELQVSPRAVTKRLERISKRVEKRLMSRLAESMPEESWARIAALRAVPRHSAERCAEMEERHAESLLAALAQVAESNGISGSGDPETNRSRE